MGDLFNQDFQEFIEALNNNGVEYILVGGYAVILHGFVRSTADMDVWINKTQANYKKLSLAYKDFGAPIFSEADFLGNTYDVWSIGTPPNRIDVMNEVKGVSFEEAYALCKVYTQEKVDIRYIHLNHLIKAKEAAGRYKDKADLEQLLKNKENDG